MHRDFDGHSAVPTPRVRSPAALPVSFYIGTEWPRFHGASTQTRGQEEIAMERLETTHEIAQWLRVSEATVLRYVGQGMPCYRAGRGRLRFEPTKVTDWLSRTPAPNTNPNRSTSHEERTTA